MAREDRTDELVIVGIFVGTFAFIGLVVVGYWLYAFAVDHHVVMRLLRILHGVERWAAKH